MSIVLKPFSLDIYTPAECNSNAHARLLNHPTPKSFNGSVPTRAKNDIDAQTRHHDHQPIDGQPQRRVSQESASPVAVFVALSTRAALDARRELRLVVLVLDQPLMVRRIRI